MVEYLGTQVVIVDWRVLGRATDPNLVMFPGIKTELYIPRTKGRANFWRMSVIRHSCKARQIGEMAASGGVSC